MLPPWESLSNTWARHLGMKPGGVKHSAWSLQWAPSLAEPSARWALILSRQGWLSAVRQLQGPERQGPWGKATCTICLQFYFVRPKGTGGNWFGCFLEASDQAEYRKKKICLDAQREINRFYSPVNFSWDMATDQKKKKNLDTAFFSLLYASSFI